jgi:hypothetical protein
VRPVGNHPVLVSTSRHVTQGIIDVTDEKWSASRGTLSGTSAVVGQDAYELRIAGLDSGGRKWKLASALVSAQDRAAGVTIVARPGAGHEEGWARVVINAPQSRPVRWTLAFE